MDEIELRFAMAPADFEAISRVMTRGRSGAQRLQAAYFDTADGRLEAHGISVRLRKEGRHWVQTAKAPTARSIARLESNVPVSPPPKGQAPLVDLSRHDGSPLAAVLDKALGAAPSKPLELRFQTDVRRRTVTMRARRSQIEIALDEGEIAAGQTTEPIRELELELKSGSVRALLELAAEWVGKHHLWLLTSSKAERGALLRNGERVAAPARASMPGLRSTATGRDFFAAVIESCLTQVLANASTVASGFDEPERVHQLRIGIRRLRTALRELDALAGGMDPTWEEDLRGVFRELGEFRDRAVVLPQIRIDLDAANAPELEVSGPPQGVQSPTAVVRDVAFQRLLLALIGFEHALSIGVSTADADPRTHVAKRLDKLWREIGRDAKRFATLETARQHRVRKRLKRLRYLSEFATPLFGKKTVDRYLETWRRAQDALGNYNDQRVAADLFRAAAPAEPHSWFAVGWLEAHKRASVSVCQRALRKAAKVRPFWGDAVG